MNPLPYLVPYALRHALPPLAAGLALAVLQSGVVAITWLLSGALLPGGVRHPLAFRALATIVGSTGATVLSEVGTSFADLPLAIPVLGGIVLLLLAADPPENGDTRHAGRTLLFAGILIGAATGLKLTNAVFAVGLVAATAVPRFQTLPATHAVGRVALGVGLGFLATGGAWAAYMWISLGNPIFPAMNKLFRSPSAAVSDYADLRFLPAGWLDALSYPAKIALGLHPTAEVPFAEPRFLLVLGALLAFAVAAGARRWRGAADGGGPDRRMARVAVFLVTSLAVWLGMFAIQRYALALEILSGVVAIMAVPLVVRGGPALPLALALALATVWATKPPDWWRRPWRSAFTAAVPPALATPATYVLVVHPTGYWASALPAASRFVTVSSSMGLAVGGALRKRLLSALDTAPGGIIRTLGYDYPMDEAAREGLAEYGLIPAKPC